MKNGEVLIIDDYYKVPLDGKKNRLFISDDNVIAQIDTGNLVGVNVSDVSAGYEALIFGNPFAGISAPALGLGALGVAVAAAGGSSSDSKPAPQAVVIESVETNSDGTLSVSGTGEPGSTATVTFPDGTTGTAPVAPDGTFGPITSATPQTSGDVTATQEDAAGNPSPATTETFTDGSAPLAPTIDNVVQNANGTITFDGTDGEVMVHVDLFHFENAWPLCRISFDSIFILFYLEFHQKRFIRKCAKETTINKNKIYDNCQALFKLKAIFLLLDHKQQGFLFLISRLHNIRKQ